MKKQIKCFVVVMLIALIAPDLMAQDFEPKPLRGIIKVIPFELTTNTFMLELESFNKTIDKSFSVGVGLTSSNQDMGNQFGLKGELMYRVYINGFTMHEPKNNREPYLRGVYAGIFTRGGYVEHTEKFYNWNPNTGNSSYLDNRAEGVWFFPGVMIGATRTLWEVLFLEAHIGAGVRFNNITNSNPLHTQEYNYYNVYDIEYNGVAPNIGFKVGVKI